MRSDPGGWSHNFSHMTHEKGLLLPECLGLLAPKKGREKGAEVGGASNVTDEAVFIISNPAYINGNI